MSGKTRQQVAQKLRSLQRTIDDGLPVIDERQTVEHYLNWWLAEVLPGSVKDSTADGYRWILERYVVPSIGRVRLAQLAPAQVQSMLRELEKRGLSVATRRQVRAILRRALGHAERWELVHRNAAALVEAPRKEGAHISDALNLDEAKALLAAARGSHLEALITVALAIGLRKGEALALRWDDVDLDASMLTVTGTLKRRVGVGLFVDTPKTERGRRTIPLPQAVVASLRQHRARQSEMRLSAGPLWDDRGFVFTTPLGTPLDPRNITREFHAITVAAGLGRRRFHALRHSAATLMLSLGVPLEVISATLGHAGYAITADVYAQVRKELQRSAADALDRALTS